MRRALILLIFLGPMVGLSRGLQVSGEQKLPISDAMGFNPRLERLPTKKARINMNNFVTNVLNGADGAQVSQDLEVIRDTRQGSH